MDFGLQTKKLSDELQNKLRYLPRHLKSVATLPCIANLNVQPHSYSVILTRITNTSDVNIVLKGTDPSGQGTSWRDRKSQTLVPWANGKSMSWDVTVRLPSPV